MSTKTTTPPAQHRDRVSEPPINRDRLALALLISAQFVVMLDISIVNVALPSIQADLGLGATGAAWVVNSYVLAFGGLLLLSGRTADLCGRRRMFAIGSAVFTAGTLLAAASGDMSGLVAGRVLQGVGAAGLSPAAMSLLLITFPGEARAGAMSTWGAASTLGGMTGVVAGGLLAGTLGWRSVFLVTVPVTMAAVALVNRLIRTDVRGARRSFDVGGAVSLTAAIVALVHGALEAADMGWTAPQVLGSFVASAVLMTVFVLVQNRVEDPPVPLELFRSRRLSAGVALAVLGGAARASTFVLLALYLQQALDMAPGTAGLAMAPTSAMGFVVSMAVLPRIIRALGAQRTLTAGLVLVAGGQLWLALAPGSAGYGVAVLPALALVATGVALSFTPTTMVIAAEMPDGHAGLASGLAGSATQVGSAVGMAAFTAIGLTFSSPASAALTDTGFSAAFIAAAGVALVTALLGARMPGASAPFATPR